MNGLLYSRKFWITIVDVLCALVAYFIPKYLAPETGNDIMFVWGSFQPVVLMLIGSIAYEDSAKHKAIAVLSAKAIIPEQ